MTFQLESLGFLRGFLVAFTVVIASVHAAMFYIHAPFENIFLRLVIGALGFSLGSLVLIFSIFNTREGKWSKNSELAWFAFLSGLLLVLVFEPWKYYQNREYGTAAFFMLIGPIASVGEYLLNKVYHIKKSETRQGQYRCFCGYTTDDKQSMTGHIAAHGSKPVADGRKRATIKKSNKSSNT